MNLCSLSTCFQRNDTFLLLSIMISEAEMIATFLGLYPSTLLEFKLAHEISGIPKMIIGVGFNLASFDTSLKPVLDNACLIADIYIQHLFVFLKLIGTDFRQQFLRGSVQTLFCLGCSNDCFGTATFISTSWVWIYWII